jgi:hypothetical protein
MDFELKDTIWENIFTPWHFGIHSITCSDFEESFTSKQEGMMKILVYEDTDFYSGFHAFLIKGDLV